MPTIAVMGCLASKQGALPVKPAFDSSEALRGDLEDDEKDSGRRPRSFALKVGALPKYSEGEQAAAGWPAWLTAVAGEAIHGLVPVKADSYEKLEKVAFLCFFLLLLFFYILFFYCSQ